MANAFKAVNLSGLQYFKTKQDAANDNKFAAKSIIKLAASWASENTVLSAGVLGIESDTQLVKIGDGTTAWNSLSYINSYNNISLTGIPIAPTAASGTSTTQIATTEFVMNALNSIINGDELTY